MTNHWIDLKNSDVILIMGANPAENHPVSFRWIMKAKQFVDRHHVELWQRTRKIATFEPKTVRPQRMFRA